MLTTMLVATAFLNAPRLPEAQGPLQGKQEEAVTCILGLLKPYLGPGQQIFWLNGPNLASMPGSKVQDVAEYRATTRFPTAKLALRVHTENGDAWSQYVYGEPPLIHIGARAASAARFADLEISSRAGTSFAPAQVDLAPCAGVLK